MSTYWFFDSALMKKTKGAMTVPGHIQKYGHNPLFREGLYEKPSLPWEPRFDNGYPNVFYDPFLQKYRCYYTSFVYDETSSSTPLQERVHKHYKTQGKRLTGMLYAESNDGIHWIKPKLGITGFNGSAENNILGLNTHGGSVMLDLNDSDSCRRYKMIARDDQVPRNIYVSFSADGYHFGEKIPVIEDPSLPGDTHNFALWDASRSLYVLYTRAFSREIRTVARLVSQDFIHWQDAREVFRGSDMDDQIYAMPVFKQDDLFFGLAAVFHSGDEMLHHHDHVEVELCYSGDGIRWQRVSPGHPFIPNGSGAYDAGDCDAGCCFASVPTKDGTDYRFYYMGGNGTHYNFRETGLCMAKLPRNRLAGVTGQNHQLFTYQTSLLSLGKRQATMCVDLHNNGSIRYELIDKTGEVIPGYSLDECIPVTVSSDRALLTWKSQDSYPESCMIRFYCQQAVLYSLSGDIVLHIAHPI